MKLLISHVPSFSAQVIQVFTFSRFSHVDFILDENTLLGSVPGKGVVIHSYKARLDASKYAVIVDIPTTEMAESYLYKWLKQQLDKPYDWGALWKTFVMNRDWQDDDKWFCSELVAAGFKIIGHPIVYGDQFNRITPGMIDLLVFERQVLKS